MNLAETPVAAPKIFTPEYYARMRELEAASWWNAGMRDVAGRLLDLAGLAREGLLLDVGCGSGQTMSWFLDARPGWRAVGLDLSIDGLRAARASGVPRVLRGSALELPLPSASVDLVISLDVLQHLPLDGGDRRALTEMARVLKPGGHVLLRTNAQTFPREPDDPEHQFHKYEPAELRQRIEQAGLVVLRLGRLNALLGLAEIPRELRARRGRSSYHGLLAEPKAEPRWRSAPKRAWLSAEGWMVGMGASWPLGRTTIALCRRPA
ncbi:MAG TPA: class I SAM-dependent methyltransferase [Vicinamibacterales bacterium]|nr:class I SAM-dependent methyltransferase [Vicinamibacterales bacterium]